MAKKEARKSEKSKTKGAQRAEAKKAGDRLKTLIIYTDGSGIPMDAKEVVSVTIIPKKRPEGLEVADYIFKDGILRFPVTLPFKERVKIVYR